VATTVTSSGKLPEAANPYPIGPRRPMASLRHERAHQTTMSLLLSLFAPTHLVANELLIMFNPRNLRAHLTPDMMVSLDAGEDDPCYQGKSCRARKPRSCRRANGPPQARNRAARHPRPPGSRRATVPDGLPRAGHGAPLARRDGSCAVASERW